VKIPEFNRQYFPGEVPQPCLAAAVKNSQLSGLATQHIAAYQDDPTCEIYLLGNEPEQICAWQRAMLEQLFERDGLASAVAEGMKEYEFECMGTPYVDFDEEERQQIKVQGIASFLIVERVVIDAIEQEVLIGIGMVGNVFHQHLIIFLRDGHWHFDSEK
jgi:ribosomal protein S18 acetylase RimI-like enzyme